ncbi:MAG: aspartate aminotransferase family protein [Candidatus Sericytochromatia bacterium]|nr:aspartate aminotransferase family protein [Candidatus Sericytochromatia bacterium]
MSHKPYFPSEGRDREAILAQMRELKEKDMNWRDGRIFSLVFSAGDEVLELLKEAHALFMSENGLNPGAFPSLRKFETEVIAMAAELLGGNASTVGNMTTGGTESILMAVKAAREYAYARNPQLKDPEIVLPVTAHPAFDKACHYFQLTPIHVPVKDDFRADVAAFKRAISSRTVLCVGSAPSYPQGVIDPIAEMADIAREKEIPFHVDACVGGFMLPFVRKLGYPVRDFDFSVPGVTSISADLHKYAYAAKGASVVLYRDAELRRHQFFVYTEWPGGIYPSPTMVGTRPGGSIAAAWAVMNFLGESGYLRIAKAVMETTRKMIAAIDAMEDVYVLGQPDMSIFAIGSETLDIYAIGDEMSLMGWHMDRQQNPACLHVTMNYGHVEGHERFLADLETAVKKARKLNWSKVSTKVTVGLVKGLSKVLPEKVFSKLVSSGSGTPKGGQTPKRTAAMYGMIGSLPNRGDVESMVLDFMDQTYRVDSPEK